MQMKSFLSSMRILVAAGSLGGFLGGWILLAHSGKPVAAQPLSSDSTISAQALPDLQPLQPLPQLQPAQLQPVPQLQPQVQQLPSFSMPALRTHGS